MKKRTGAITKIKDALESNLLITRKWANQKKLNWDTVVKRISDLRKTMNIDKLIDEKGKNIYLLSIKKQKKKK